MQKCQFILNAATRRHATHQTIKQDKHRHTVKPVATQPVHTRRNRKRCRHHAMWPAEMSILRNATWRIWAPAITYTTQKTNKTVLQSNIQLKKQIKLFCRQHATHQTVKQQVTHGQTVKSVGKELMHTGRCRMSQSVQTAVTTQKGPNRYNSKTTNKRFSPVKHQFDKQNTTRGPNGQTHFKAASSYLLMRWKVTNRCTGVTQNQLQSKTELNARLRHLQSRPCSMPVYTVTSRIKWDKTHVICIKKHILGKPWHTA